MIYRITPILAFLAIASAQYGGGYDRGYNGGYDHGSQQGYNNNNYNNKYNPHVAILNHKQALGHDGSFNYAFNAENGIQQGESINPDGSRQGAFSYVDPSGKTVSLKYIAGKDGFKVLEGDHIPRSVPLPAQHAAAYQAAHAQHEAALRNNGPGYQGYQSAPAPSYGGSAQYRRPYGADDAEDDKGSYYEPSNQQQNYRSYNSAHDDEPINNGPHSFGSGYAFEFAG